MYRVSRVGDTYLTMVPHTGLILGREFTEAVFRNYIRIRYADDTIVLAVIKAELHDVMWRFMIAR